MTSPPGAPHETILFLAANPTATGRLAIDAERRAIEKRAKEARGGDRLHVHDAWAVRIEDLRAALLEHRPTIVHFSGHGQRVEGSAGADSVATATSALIVADASGKPVAIPPEALAELFRILGGGVRCVVLNACYSALQAEAIGKHVDYVVGMAEGIRDDAAIAFSGAFYEALGFDMDVEKAFDLGKSAIKLSGLSGADVPRLLMRGNAYVHRKAEETTALNRLRVPGQPLVLWGPWRCGKTTMLRYLLRRVARADGDRSLIVEVNLKALMEWLRLSSPQVTLDGLLAGLAREIVQGCSDKDAWLAEIEADPNLGWPQRLKTLLGDRLLREVPGRLVLAIDGADAVWKQPFETAFFGLLRSFCELAKEPWERFRLALPLTPMPWLPLRDSPLVNLAPPVKLGDFQPDQVAEMARRQGVNWDRDAFERHLRPLVGGHPPLLQVLLEHARTTGASPEDLAGNLDALLDLFDVDLAKLGGMLEQDAAVRAALTGLLAGKRRPLDDEMRLRLKEARLIDPAPGGRHKIRYGLYEAYLRRRWQPK